MSLGKLWCVSFMDFFLSFSFVLSFFIIFPQFFYKEGALHFTSYAITHDIFLLVHDCSVGVTWSNTPQLKLSSVHWFTPWNIPQFFKPYIQFNESLYLHWIQDERAFWYIWGRRKIFFCFIHSYQRTPKSEHPTQ